MRSCIGELRAPCLSYLMKFAHIYLKGCYKSSVPSRRDSLPKSLCFFQILQSGLGWEHFSKLLYIWKLHWSMKLSVAMHCWYLYPHYIYQNSISDIEHCSIIPNFKQKYISIQNGKVKLFQLLKGIKDTKRYLIKLFDKAKTNNLFDVTSIIFNYSFSTTLTILNHKVLRPLEDKDFRAKGFVTPNHPTQQVQVWPWGGSKICRPEICLCRISAPSWLCGWEHRPESTLFAFWTTGL